MVRDFIEKIELDKVALFDRLKWNLTVNFLIRLILDFIKSQKIQSIAKRTYDCLLNVLIVFRLSFQVDSFYDGK